MIGSTHSNGGGILFLKALGIVGLLFSWLAAFRPKMKVYWGRGANRPLMSRRSRVAFAIAATGWCLGVFGANQRLALLLFATGFALAVISGKQDEKDHVARTGTLVRKPPEPKDFWLALCLMDSVLLPILLFALVRDYFHPPVTDEQKSVHGMAIIMFVLLLVAAVALYLNRPEKISTGPQE
jgi:hypothetical protein